MPNIDKCQLLVIFALQLAGWQIITPTRRRLYKDRQIFLDIVAEKDGATVYIEVKCFADNDTFPAVEYMALGQILFYRATLTALNDQTPIYLAVPRRAYIQFDEIAHSLLEANSVKLLIFDEDGKDDLEWIHRN